MVEGDRGPRLRPVQVSLMGAVAVGLVVWAVTTGSRPLNDNSFLTHVATGRYLLDHGVPDSDIYSFTAPGTPWVVQSWLASFVYGALDQLGGGHALQLLHAALSGVLAALVVRLTRPAEMLVSRLGIGALAVAIGTVTWVERPLLFGLVGLAVLLVLLEEDGPAWVMVPVMWVWANAHGSHPLALVLLVAVIAGRRLDGLEHQREVRLLLFTAAGIVTAIAGPLLLDVVTFPVALLGRREVLDNIVEWQSPRFTDTGQRLFLLEVVAAVVALVRRPAWRRALPALAFVVMALLAARNMAVANLVLVPVVAHGLRGLGSLTGAARSRLVTAAAAALVALGAVVVAERVGGPAWRLDAYPVPALAWLHAEGLAGGDGRVAAPDFVGNARTLLEGAGTAVFIDDRYDMWPAGLVDDYEVLLRGRPGWEAVLDRWEVSAVLWQADQPLAELLRLDAGWRVAYADRDWLVALPRS